MQWRTGRRLADVRLPTLNQPFELSGHKMTSLLSKKPVQSAGRVYGVLVAVLAVILVAAPMLFTDSGFAVDFTNHLWLTWAAGNGLSQTGHPSYFLNTPETGVFYPWFAFYGGSLYMLVGGVSELMGGQPVVAYVGATTLAITGSYLGMVWLGREFGLRGWVRHAPALVVVTSAYYITNLYGRGAWTEFIATAVISPLLASGIHLARASRWRVGPMLVFIVSAIIFSGSHNITLLWGSTVAVVAGLILWLAMGRPGTLPLRRIARLCALGVASVLVNAWYLVPDVGYAQDVSAHAEAYAGAGASFFDTPAVLLDPLRTVPVESSTPALFVQAPVWFLAWGLVVGPLLLWRAGAPSMLRRAWSGVAFLVGLLLAMLMITPVWTVMPFPFDEIQYPYRLSSYIYYAIAALVLVGALALQRASSAGGDADAGIRVRVLKIGLAGVCAVSIGLCVWQLWVPSTLFPKWSYDNRQEALVSPNKTPRTWYDPGSYNDDSARIVSVPSERALAIDPTKVRGDRFAGWVEAPPGLAPIRTNIASGSYLVHLSGLTWLGRSSYGYAVVRREKPGNGPVYVVLQTKRSPVIVAGWVLSLAGLVAVLAILAWASVRAISARRQKAA
jgi:hypothetical protein